MEICLINLPRRKKVPLDLCYVGSYLKTRGHGDLKLIDLSIVEDEIPKATYYCISCSPDQIMELGDIIKKIDYATSYVAATGKFATHHAEDCLKISGIDMAIMGDPEIPFTMLVEGYEISQIPGAAFMWAGEVKGTTGHHGGKRIVLNNNLDELPFPDRGLLNSKWLEPPMRLVTARKGLNERIRYRSVEDVMKEVDFLSKKYKVKDFVFTEPKKDEGRTKKFHEAFENRGFNWRCYE